MPAASAPIRGRNTRPDRRRRLAGLFASLALALVAAPTPAQTLQNPVYVDDSTAAADALLQARARLAADDATEAVRLLQAVLVAEGDRLLPSPDDPDLFITVRRRVRDEILGRPALLARYRDLLGPPARERLDAGDERLVARDFFLTTAGFDATLRVAERRLESARFDSAWRTLAPLDTHPDRAGDRATRALALLDRIRQYTDAAGADRLAQRWAAQTDADNAAPITRVTPPPLNIGRTTLEPGPRVTLDDLVARPLASVKIPAPATGADEGKRPRSPRRASGQASPLNYMLPTVTAGAIYFNDGHTLSAYERFTLQPLWRDDYSPAQNNQRSAAPHVTNGRNAIEDLATVAVAGRFAVAVGGIATRGLREDDDRVHAVDALTGAPRWSVAPADLSPSLASGSFRGPPIIDQGVVVLGVVKSVKERRLLSFHMVGIDLATGALRWTRPLGSSGTLPYGAVAKIADLPTAHDGIVYQMDSLGFVSAVDAVTGELRWLRRLPLKAAAIPIKRTWDGASLVLDAGRLYTITPDRRDILTLDADTGAVVARRPTTDFRDPEYLVHAADHLVAVGDERITSIPFASFADAQVTPTIIMDARASSITGRVAVAGARVLAPTPEGVLVARAGATGPDHTQLAPLDQSGNLVALESELVVADARSLHTYLIWDVAQRVLTERMAQSPEDPAPAVTFVDLAYRAGRVERILPAVDAALTAIARNPLDDAHAQARARLFESLWSIVTAHGDDALTGVPPDLENALIDRLGQAAASPPQRVRFLLARGASDEANDDGAAAIDSYQQILDTPALAHAKFDSAGVEAQADLEATKGLARVVRRFGRAAYQTYEDEAARSLAALGDIPDPSAYAALAHRYPVAPAAARAWLLAADRYERQNATRRALAALEDGLSAADNALVDDPALLGELTGRLITAQIDAGRLESAAATISRIAETRPGLVLTSRGRTLSITSLAQRVSARLAATRRRPRIGEPADDAPTRLLTGWIIQRPLLNADSPPSTESITLRSDAGLGLFRLDPAGGLREVWRADLPPASVILATTWNAVYTLEPGARGRRIARLDRATGELTWRTDDLNDLLPETGASLPTLATFVAMDHRSLAIVRSDGAAAAYDLATGARLWRRPMLLPVIADAAADADTLLIVGDRTRPNPQRPAQPPNPGAVAVDLRTGETIQRLEPHVGAMRWVRLTPEGLAIIGGDQGVVAHDLLRERQVWRADDLAGLRTIDAWPFAGRVLILDDDAGLWMIESGAGRPAARALDTRDRIARTVLTGEPLHVASIGDAVAIAGIDGLLVYDRAGDVIGADQRGDPSVVLPAAIGLKHAVTVAANPAFMDAGALWHDLFIFNLPGAALAQRRLVNLEATPDDIALLDGRILISAGKATLVVDAPVD